MDDEYLLHPERIDAKPITLEALTMALAYQRVRCEERAVA